MANNTTVKVNYLSRDFSSLRQDLINFAKTRHPDKFAYFNDASPDMMYLEMCAYVGDMLSYYTDKTFNENFLTTAQSREALVRITSDLGFFETGSTPASTQVTLSIRVPYVVDGDGNIIPDPDLLISIQPGMLIRSDNGTSYEILEEVVFADERNRILIPNVDGNNVVVDYTIEKTVPAYAGQTKIQRFYVSPDLAKPFMQVTLDDKDVIEIVGVVDVPGIVYSAPADQDFVDPDKAWFEVTWLTQDTKFVPINPLPQTNSQFTNLIPSTVQQGELVNIPRRFLKRRDVNNLVTLTFGSSQPNFGAFNSLIQTTIDPNTVSFNQVLNNTVLGEIPPANSTLFIKYRVGGGETTNSVVGKLNTIVAKTFDPAPNTVNLTLLNQVRNSLSVRNDIPAIGGKSIPSNEEIRASVGKSFAAQGRIVTYEDLKVAINELPARFGRPFRFSYEEIKPRVANFQQVKNGIDYYVTQILTESTQAGRQLAAQDLNSFLNNLQIGVEQIDPTTNTLTTLAQTSASLLSATPTLWLGEKARLYVLGIDDNGQLVTSIKDNNGVFVSPLTNLKNNLVEFLREKRLIGDWVDIVDGRVINITVEFSILVDKKNKQQVLIEALTKLRNYFAITNWQMNQPIFIANVMTILQEINGVINVVDLKFYNIFGTEPISGRTYQPQESGRYRRNKLPAVNLANNKFEMDNTNNVIVQWPDSIFEVKYLDSDIIGTAITV